jgi:hypothetical protein
MSDPEHVSGKALDRCICVHAEQNSLITAARFGIRVEGATLYTTQSPCFGCLKESIQAGLSRVVYESWYPAKYSEPLKNQYQDLANLLMDDDPTRFEALGGTGVGIKSQGQPDPYEDLDADEPGLVPPMIEDLGPLSVHSSQSSRLETAKPDKQANGDGQGRQGPS